MGLLRAIINIINIFLRTFILLVKTLFRFRLLVLIFVTVGSLIINISLFTGTLYFEKFNSIFETMTRITPVAYKNRETIKLFQEELTSSKKAFEDQYAASIVLINEVEQLSQSVSSAAETIDEQNNQNELLKGLLRQNERLNEELSEENSMLSDSQLSVTIQQKNTKINILQDQITKFTDNLSDSENKMLRLKKQMSDLSQTLLVKDSRILDLRDQLDELSKNLSDLETANSTLRDDLDRRNVKGY